MTRALDYQSWPANSGQAAQLFVFKAYYAIMARGADPSGWNFWAGSLIPAVTAGDAGATFAQKVNIITNFVNAANPALFSSDYNTRREALRQLFRRREGYPPVREDAARIDGWANPAISAAQVAAGFLLDMIDRPVDSVTAIPDLGVFVGDEFNNRVSFSIRAVENGVEATAADLAPITSINSTLTNALAARGW